MLEKLNAATLKPSTSKTNGNAVIVHSNYVMGEPLDEFEVVGQMYTGSVQVGNLNYEQQINAGPFLVVRSDEQTRPWHTSFALPKLYNPFAQIKSTAQSTSSPYFKKAFRYWNTTKYHAWRANTYLTHVDGSKSRILKPISDSEINPPAPKPGTGKRYLPGGYTVPQQNLPIGVGQSMAVQYMSIAYMHGVAASQDWTNLQNRLAKFFTAKVYTNNQNPDANGEIEYSKGGPKISVSTVKEEGDPKRDYSMALYSTLEQLWKAPFVKLQKGSYPLHLSFKFGPTTTPLKNTTIAW